LFAAQFSSGFDHEGPRFGIGACEHSVQTIRDGMIV